MRSVVVRILWLAAIGALLYGGFVAYERWWEGDWGAVKDRTFSFVRETARSVKSRAAEEGGRAFEKAKGEAAEAAKNTVASVVGDAIGSVGSAITSFGLSVAGTPPMEALPPAGGPAYATPPPPVALSARAGSALAFAINRGDWYRADWGDGASDEGDKVSDATVLLRHAWEAAGDYTVTLATRAEGNVREEKFPIRIYER